MLKIGEFSRIVRVSARMLRYYEENGLLQPAEIDRFTGYRLYTVDQISELRRITELRDMGFNVEEIAETLPQLNDAEYMRKILAKKREQIYKIITEEENKLERIAEMNERILNNIKENNMFIGEVELKKLDSVRVLALITNISDDKYDSNEEQKLWQKLHDYIKANDIKCGVGGYTEYIYDAEYGSQVKIAVPVLNDGRDADGFVYSEIGGLPLAATVKCSGDANNKYQSMVDKITDWMQANGYRFGTGNVPDCIRCYSAETVTELQVAVEKV